MNQYSALVIKFDSTNLSIHPNADKLSIYEINGAQVVVNKHLYNDGDICLYFLPDTQIEKWFLVEHRLYRKNPDDLTEKWEGFFEPDGKVRIVKLRGTYSQGFIFKLSDSTGLTEGDLIDSLNGQHLCHKFETKAEKQFKIKAEKAQPKRNFFQKLFYQLTKKLRSTQEHVMLKEHIDTSQLVHMIREYREGDLITITKKYHGTSGRTAKLIVPVKVNIFDKRYWADGGFKRFYKTLFLTTEQTGTRRTLVCDSLRNIGMDQDATNESYRMLIHKMLVRRLKEQQTIYYEIVGFEPSGKPIMPNHDKFVYSYGCAPKEFDVIVYRVTETNVLTNVVREFTFQELQEFCDNNSLRVVEPVAQFVYDGTPKSISDFVVRYCEENPYHQEGLLEGLVVRNDNPDRCVFAKFKSNLFSEAEGIAKQSEKFIDIETMN